MVDEAQQFAEEDQRKQTEAEVRNQADNLIFSTEKILEEHSDKVEAELKQEIETKLGTLRTALQANDVASIQNAMTELNAPLQKLGEVVYAQSTAENANPEPESQESQEPQDDGTVEGEFRDVE